MNQTVSCKALGLSLLLAMSSLSIAQAKTTTADFLSWDRKNQDSFFSISMSMAGIFAAQVRPKIASCLDEWYFKDEKTKQRRNSEMLNDMASYKIYHPNAVILGFVEKNCGSLKNDG